MTSYLSRFSPVPAFADYTGPHKVGTIDVELPVLELDVPSPAPEETISTVQYRIFYPCEPESKGKGINWLPNPQRGYTSGYTKFLGAGSTLADFISFIPNALHYISIPVRKNAPLLKPTSENKRWPVLIFSHGLGGSRNAYSALVGQIASHGVVVIAPEHRDGSTPISYIRDVASNNSVSEKHSAKHAKRTVEYVKLSHTPSPEVEAARNAQLKIRLWELGAIHDSLLQIDRGTEITNLNSSSIPLTLFKNSIDVLTPGKIAFAGHSFGAATVTQFIKSTFYSSRTSEAPADYEPLFSPSSRSPIIEQITPQTPLILLDVWCLPLRAATTRWLWNLPLPCYSSPTTPGGAALLAVESEAFFKWTIHLKATKRLLSPDPSSHDYQFSPSQENTWPEPNFYYATASAHLSQSDFGVLFPWVTKRFLAAEEPERVMRLNCRAILQLMRNNGIDVSDTSAKDMEISSSSSESVEVVSDSLIFGKENQVRSWNWISTDINDVESETESSDDEAAKGKVETSKVTEPSQAVVGNELLKQTAGTAERL